MSDTVQTNKKNKNVSAQRSKTNTVYIYITVKALFYLYMYTAIYIYTSKMLAQRYPKNRITDADEACRSSEISVDFIIIIVFS
jgi:hypothetical protein